MCVKNIIENCLKNCAILDVSFSPLRPWTCSTQCWFTYISSEYSNARLPKAVQWPWKKMDEFLQWHAHTISHGSARWDFSLWTQSNEKFCITEYIITFITLHAHRARLNQLSDWYTSIVKWPNMVSSDLRVKRLPLASYPALRCMQRTKYTRIYEHFRNNF